MAKTAPSAAIIGGNRIPFARSGGPYAEASNQDMLTAALDGLIARFALRDERLGEVAAGAVLKHSRDFNLTRECVLGSALDHATPAYDVQQACDTGLQTVIAVANKIETGRIEAGIAGGVDTTSDAPIEIDDDRRQLDAAVGRRVDRPARQRRVGRGAQPPGARAPGRIRGRRRRLRERRRRAAHRADLRGAADARPRGPDVAGLRLLRDPRGLRCAGRIHAEGLGGRGVLPRAARPRPGARSDRPLEAEREGR